MAEYKYLDFVARVVNAAQARVPRIQQSAISTEITYLASRAVAQGNVVQVGDDLMTADGKSPENFVHEIIAARTDEDGNCFMLVPKEVVEVQDGTWTSGSLTKQGARFNVIRSVFGKGKEGDLLAKAAFEAEAALYQTRPGSTVPGVAPGTKPEAEAGATGGVGPRLAVNVQPSDNPWKRDQWRGTEEMRQAKIQSIIKASTKMADGLARAAGTDLAGRPLRPTLNKFEGTRMAKQPQFKTPKHGAKVFGEIIVGKVTFGPPEWKRRRAARKLAAKSRGEGADPFQKLAEYNARRAAKNSF